MNLEKPAFKRVESTEGESEATETENEESEAIKSEATETGKERGDTTAESDKEQEEPGESIKQIL